MWSTWDTRLAKEAFPRSRKFEEIVQDFIELKKAFTKGGIQAFLDFEVGYQFI